MASAFTSLRAMFYLLTPSETYFEKMEDVPDYVVQVIQLFFVFQVLEFGIAWYRGKLMPRLNDTFSSVTAGIISRIPRLFFRSIELTSYIWVYNNVHILPHVSWNSPWSYWIGFLGMDLGYYWFHRMGHEINLFWATHQSHHSSENYNLSTALRQGVLQAYCSWIFYLPLALVIPPQTFMIHAQMNLLYQFWIHTDVISNLGPFEYILNTPSHHRVHHGRNPYCIDKNYAGVLIIWDRIFGTFAAERDDEQIAYGIIHPINTFDPIETQLGHLKYVIQQFIKVEGWSNKLAVIWKGPGWEPGLPRLGSSEFPPIEHPIKVYDPKISTALSAYTAFHFILTIVQFSAVLKDAKNYSTLPLLLYSIILLLTLSTFGAIFDQKKNSLSMERLRLALIFLAPRIQLTERLFVLQSHVVVQGLLFLSLIATFFINPVSEPKKLE